MTKSFSLRIAVAAVVGLGLALTSPTTVRAESKPYSDAEKQAVGCLVGVGVAGIGAFLTGATETMMLAAGGLMVPSGTRVLMLGLVGTTLGATCAIGASATPAVLWLTGESGYLRDSLTSQASAFGDGLGRLAGDLSQASGHIFTRLAGGVARPASQPFVARADHPGAVMAVLASGVAWNAGEASGGR
ncbi:membrane hypothetical protein [uncultured Gammaproteobacteria bacterium]